MSLDNHLRYIERAQDFTGKLKEKVTCNCIKAVNGVDEDYVSIHTVFALVLV